MKLEVFRQIIEKRSSNIKFYQNPSSVVLCGQTDGHDEVNSRLCNFANAPKNGVRVCGVLVLYKI